MNTCRPAGAASSLCCCCLSTRVFQHLSAMQADAEESRRLAEQGKKLLYSEKGVPLVKFSHSGKVRRHLALRAAAAPQGKAFSRSETQCLSSMRAAAALQGKAGLSRALKHSAFLP